MNAPDLFQEPEGATPLDPENAKGLIPTWVATRGDLNTAEQENIAKAIAWASSRGRSETLESLMTVEAMKDLRRRMFGEVWKWAGSYRQHDTNLGTHWPYIQAEVCDLLADVLMQTADLERPPWPPDELAVRFHYRLVVIHPFPNGNGRHARLAADLLVAALGRPEFSWGAQDLNEEGAARGAYLDALHQTDRCADFGRLVSFARS